MKKFILLVLPLFILLFFLDIPQIYAQYGNCTINGCILWGNTFLRRCQSVQVACGTPNECTNDCDCDSYWCSPTPPAEASYTGSYTGSYEAGYTGTYTGSYEGGYESGYTGSYTGSYTGEYTGSYTGSYTGDYTATYTGTYCVPQEGQACSKTSGANACGQTNTNTGAYDCDGICNAPDPSVPANPPGLGSICSKVSPPNACGQTNGSAGTIVCDGSCNAPNPSTPPNPPGYGNTCTKDSAANICGDFSSTNGTIACNGSCNAAEPETPSCIYGTVYKDLNNPPNATGGPAYSSASLTLSNGTPATTDVNGTYIFHNLPRDYYWVTLNDPAGWTSQYAAASPNPRTIGWLGYNGVTDGVANFGLAPNYSISGFVFVDHDHDGVYNHDDVPCNSTNGGCIITLTGDANRSVSTNSDGTYSFPYLQAGNYSVSVTYSSNYQLTYPASSTLELTLGPSAANVNFGVTPRYTISGFVINDIGNNYNPSLGKAGVKVFNTTNGSSTTTDANGLYSFTVLSGTYTLTYEMPSGYTNTYLDNTQKSVIVNHIYLNGTVNFYITPYYAISGNLFSDANKNTRKDGGETNMGVAQRVTLDNLVYADGNPNKLTDYNTVNGVYSFPNLRAGSYHVIYTSSLPAGYKLIYPTNGAPQSYFSIVIGPSCSISPNNGDPTCYQAAATLYTGSIQNANFALTNSFPWIQCKGADCREDAGFVNPIPAAVTCGAYSSVANNPSSTTPGVIFSGNGDPDFGQGQASPYQNGATPPWNWVVGGISYPETYSTPISGSLRTSYAYLDGVARESGLTFADMEPYCVGGLNSCTLTAGFTNGLYKANGNLVLNSFTFPAGKNYVILVNGNLTIAGTIKVPTTSTVTFSVKNDIIVPSTLGQADPLSTVTDMEGFYSADRNVLIQGVNDCTIGADKKLNVAGSLVANAGLVGGAITLSRDLCAGNLICSALTIIERPDMIINAPPLIHHPNYTWQEVAP